MAGTNQFSALLRMLETRIARQKQALAESELQLLATRESFLKEEERINAQGDLVNSSKVRK